jgi:L-rhamnose mutarotase
MERIAQIISVKPEAIEEYERIHRSVWPDVLATIAACHIRNYSIFRLGTTLFAYFEYHGGNYADDMARMAEDPKTQEWWNITDPMQTPVAEHAQGEWWTRAKEVFHVD